MTTKRKPYIREVSSCWWRKLPAYRFYMLRECTAIPAIWFSLLLIHALSSLKGGELSWMFFIQSMKNPLMLILNTIALFSAAFHTTTWLAIAPKAVRVLPKIERYLVLSLWGATGFASLVILILALIA